MDTPEIGKTYKVEANDCCVDVMFVATLNAIIPRYPPDEEGDDPYQNYIFSNGVTISKWGVSYEEIK